MTIQLHEWIEKQPHVIQLPNVSDSLFVKINGAIVKKQKHILQIANVIHTYRHTNTKTVT